MTTPPPTPPPTPRRRGGRRPRRPPLQIAGEEIAAGRRAQVEVPIAHLISGASVGLPMVVVHGGREGPFLWLCAAVHGDEVCGVEIIRCVLGGLDARSLSGTLITVPVANVYGFNTGDRYLPDRRDLNRSFPGSPRGSLAARIAHVLMTEVIGRCQVGIDLHTGSDGRINLPQVRGDLDDAETLRLARVFGAPVAIHSRTRDGSLREAATEAGATVLLYEGGEANRFDSAAIETGTSGIHRVMHELGMTDDDPPPGSEPLVSRRTAWMRSARSGVVHLEVGRGDRVERGTELATIRDPIGKRLSHMTARTSGIVISHVQEPLVHRGDAVLHLAEV